VRQDRRADETRAADPAIAEDIRQAIDHDASPASAGDLDLEVEGGGFTEGGERQEHRRTLVQRARRVSKPAVTAQCDSRARCSDCTGIGRRWLRTSAPANVDGPPVAVGPGLTHDLSTLAPRLSQIDLQPLLEYLLTVIARELTLV
jgi:hypothetical protein